MSWLSSLYHGLTGDTAANAATNAANIQSQTADKNAALAQDYTGQSLSDLSGAQGGALSQYDQGQGYQQPAANAGNLAISRLSDIYGLNGAAGNANALSNFQASPGYQWQLQQGQQGLDRASNARGGFYSGAALKGAADYNQNQANSEWGNYTSGLSGLAGMGQTASGRLSDLAGMKANALLGTAQNRGAVRQGGLSAITDANAQSGAALAGGQLNAANAHTSALNNLLSLGGTIAGFFAPNKGVPSGSPAPAAPASGGGIIKGLY